MTWAELKRQITELGFNVVNYEYENIYNESKAAYITAANRAILLISITVRPILGEVLIITQPVEPNLIDSKLPRYMEYDMKELAGDSFMDFAADEPMIELESGDHMPIPNAITQKRSLLYIPQWSTPVGSKIRVWYKKKPTVITETTPDDFEIELDYDVQLLVPLLASHYVWLDDEPAKAGIYWNQYDILKNEILRNSEDTRIVQKLINTTGWW